MEIIALANLKMIEKSKVAIDSDGMPIDSNILVFNNKNNKWHLAGLNPNKFYIREGEKISFSMTDFNWIRDFLLSIIGSNKISFAELINFHPENATIGPVCSKKLKHDFQDYQCLVKGTHSEIYNSFDKWMKAFSLAANKGAVIFA